MKVRDETIVHTTGNIIPQETVRMTVDQASLSHLMSIMTDLYSNPALAVIREYSTNALDSHRAAGNAAPIEIELPSGLRPTFVVRDHGVGMSHDDIRDHFSKYGYSSKRDTNNEVGILGLGCKSGLTYTNQFTMIAIKDGLKIVVLISKDETGVGVLKVLDTVTTTEPNGVEIQIPVPAPQVGPFNEQAANFFRFWEKGTVLVNGEPPVSVFDWDETLTLDEDVIIVPTHRVYNSNIRNILDQDYVVMGNIAYPAARKISQGILNQGYCFVVRLDIGEIDFTPSREALHYTPHTNATLQACAKFGNENLERHIATVVDAQPTRWEAAKEAARWYPVTNKTPDRVYKGEKIPTEFRVAGWTWHSGRVDNSASKLERLSMLTVMHSNTVILRDHPASRIDARSKANLITKYGTDKNVYALSSAIDAEMEPWIRGCEQTTYGEIHPKLPRQKRDPGQASEYFKWMIYTDGKFIDSDQDMTTPRVCYVLRADPDDIGVSHTREAYRALCAGFITQLNRGENLPEIGFAVIRKPELERFLKRHPGAVHFTQLLQTLLTDIETKLSDDALIWECAYAPMAVFDSNMILDPEVAAVVRRFQLATNEEVRTLWKQRKEVIQAGHQLARQTFQRREAKSNLREVNESVHRKYPLLSDRSHAQTKDLTEYLNATFTYRKQGK